MTKTHHIEIVSPSARLNAAEGALLADCLEAAGIPISLYCRKRGICGKCFVEILEGELPPPGETESWLLAQRGLPPNCRLSCLYRVRGRVRLRIPEAFRLGKISILDTGTDVPADFSPWVRKYFVKTAEATLHSPYSLAEGLERFFRRRLLLPLDVLRSLPGIEDEGGGEFTAVVFRENEVLSLERGDTTSANCGVAVDIGTSTVVVELLDLNTGRPIGRAAAVNSQIPFGADIVSRITHAFRNPAGLSDLSGALRGLLNRMIRDLAAGNGVSPEDVYEIVAAGNTAMSHFLLGIPVDALAVSPFHGAFSSASPVRAKDIGLNLNPQARVYIAPNIKSFVGGDVSAGLAALDLHKTDGSFLFIDLGTNGEIVLKKGRECVATSTAAGPAFEGMNLSCGSLALPGAVHAASWDGGFVLRTIGDEPARGICGTGLIDILALCVRHGLVDSDGKIAGAEKKLRLSESLALSQQDIREMQLAIAAVKTGVGNMLKRFGVAIHDLQRIYIAGAFGNSLNIANGVAIGLLPDAPRDRIVFVGNSSLAGARKLLLSGPERKTIEAFVRKVKHVSLAMDPAFQGQFVEALALKPYSGGTP